MSLLVDLFATLSILGIWPRFIEPGLLKTTYLTWNLSSQAESLSGCRIVHLTDLHFHAKYPSYFLNKILREVKNLHPDIIVFTGDFLCYSLLPPVEPFVAFLNELKAPLGSYAVFGNHDYSHYVSLNPQGVYDVSQPVNPLRGTLRGMYTLVSALPTGSQVSEKARSVSLHTELCHLLSLTPFMMLENETTTLPIGLNITGLGDLALGRCLPEKAFFQL